MTLRRFKLSVAFALCACCVNAGASQPPPLPSRIFSQGQEAHWDSLQEKYAERTAFYELLKPPATKTTRARRVSVSADVTTGDVWWQLALCESGGTNASTGNGFYGYFQFVPATFRSLGYDGLPTDYGYDVQREAAQRLQTRSGWGQWPLCSRKLGLR